MIASRSPTIDRILFRLILFRLLLPLCVITIVVFGLGAYLITNNITARQLRLTRSLTHTVNSYLDQTGRALATIAQVAKESSANELTHYMQATWHSYSHFDALYHISDQGRIINLVPYHSHYQGLDMSRQIYFQATRSQANLQISKPFMSPRTGKPTVYLAWPLSDGGIIVGELNLGVLQQTIAADFDPNDQDTVFIADQTGTLLAHPRFELVAQQTNVSHLQRIRQGLRAETTLLYTNPSGVILGSATPVGQTHWVVVAEVPLRVAYEPLAGAVALAFLLSLTAWILLAWGFKRQFEHYVVVPLAHLGRGADALAAGDFERGEAMVGYPGALTEIVALGANFKRMSEAIQARQAALQESETRLRQSQKMQAVGQLAGGIAHDFNNLLTVIFGYIGEVLITLPRDHMLRPDILEIQTAARRAASLTQQLLAFSRRQVLQPEVLDLNQTVAEMREMLSRLIGEHINLVIIPGDPLDPVKVDPGQMQQVIMNLAINARDAMPRGGILTIKLANTELKRPVSSPDLEIQPGPYAMLSVSDTGIGMDEETMSHIFEPFFTTKDKSKGTGLGLATTHGVVKQSGGHIEVISKLGRGSIFNIYLPRADLPACTEAGAQSPNALLDGSETVLLVEDEEMVRELANRILKRKGYQVLQANCSAAAFQLCTMYQGTIDLLLTDVIMPGDMNGRELAEQLRLHYPVMKVIYMSGYTDSILIRQEISSAERSFLPKPFTPDSLLLKVKEVLNHTP